MKILGLKIENLMKVAAFDYRPTGPVVTIGGRNEQGKSSVLNSIWLILQEAAARKGLKITEPVHKGAKKGFGQIDLGDIIVTRTWTGNDSSYLKVESKDGKKYPSPQTLLDGLIGNLSFDPLAFTNMDAKKQREILLDLVKIDLDLKKWAEDRQKFYDARTIVNRNVDDSKSQIKLLGDVPSDTPDEETSASAVITEMQEAQKIMTANDVQRQKLSERRNEAARIKQENDNRAKTIAALRQELAELEETQWAGEFALESIISGGRKLAVEVDKLIDPDLSGYEEKIKKVEDTNRLVRLKAKKKELETRLHEDQAATEAHTINIEMLDQTKASALKQAKFPIEGLSFDDNGVFYKGIPFPQCSSAERLRVSIAMAMALNKDLRVIRIADANLLDSHNMKIIEEMTAAHDYQLWIERVQEKPDSTVSVFIEDGVIKTARDQETVPEPEKAAPQPAMAGTAKQKGLF